MRCLPVALLASGVLVVGCSDESPRDGVDPVVVSNVEVTAGGFTFTARVAGPENGEVVMLLHGFPESSYEWRAQLQALGEAGYRAVAPDQRGYSVAARPSAIDDYAVPLLIGDVTQMADALGADTFHLVGHDWGAAVAWGVAGLAPDRVRTLTTMSIPHPDAFNRELANMESCQYEASSYFELLSAEGIENVLLANDAGQLKALYEGLPQDAVDEYLRVLGTSDALGAAVNWYRANLDGRMIDAPSLGAIQPPTLFIWSDEDTAVCREGAEGTADFVTGPYQFEVLSGIAHWIPELAASEVNALLLAHLAR